MRQFINILNEFIQPSDDNRLPPAELAPDRGGREEGGTYWVSPMGKVLVSREEHGRDHAQMVYTHPEEFGLTWRDVEAAVAPFEFHARSLARWKKESDAGSHFGEYSRSNPDSTLGGRALGQNILFARGWVLVQYHPPQRISIWGCSKGLRNDIETVMDQFPLMKLDEISVLKFDATGREWTPVSARFKKSDYPGFGSNVNAMMEWIKS